MRIRVLGPVTVGTETGASGLGGPKPKALLVALLRQARHVVATERLVDLLWDDSPPSSATALVHTYVSVLRRGMAAAGLAEAVRTRAPGYLLDVEHGECDVDLFEHEHERAREAERDGAFALAHEHYRRALSLWRGQALGGVDARFAVAWADELHERRLAARDGLARSDLALGRAEDAAHELRGLVTEHPLREETRALLMRALAESGRQADALEVYREGRRHLLDELGIEPGRPLRDLHTAILDGSVPATRATPASPVRVSARPVAHTLPPDIGDFTGRTGELASVLALGGTPPDDRVTRPVVVVSGAGGTGKSTLAVHAAHRLAPRYPDGQLFVDLRGFGAELSPFTALGRFLTALGVRAADLPTTLDERIALYRQRLAGLRLIIVLDNARAEQQVRPLLPGEPGCLVLVTSRSRLAGIGGAFPVELEVLRTPSALEMLGKIIGPERVAGDPDAAGRIAALCAGVPLAIRAAGAKLLARPHWPLKSLAARLADERRRLDELTVGDLAIRSCLSLNYAELDDRRRRAFHLLCLLDLPDFGWWLAAPLLDVDTAEAEDVVEHLVDLRLLDVAGVDQIGRVRYRFHDLVQLFGAEQAAEHETRETVTDAVARSLTAWADLVEAGARRLPRVTLGLRIAPSRQAEAHPELIAEVEADPVGWLRAETSTVVRAVERARELGVGRTATLLVSSLLSSTFAVRNEFDGWQRTQEVALALAREGHDRRAEAVVLAGLGQLHYEKDDFATARTHFEQALRHADAVDDDAVRAVCLVGIGTVRREQGHVVPATYALTTAADLAERLGEDSVVAAAEYGLGALHRDHGDLGEAADRFRRAAHRYAAVEDPRGEALAMRGLSLCHRARGEYREAADLSGRAAANLLAAGDELGATYSRQAWVKASLRLVPAVDLVGPLVECLAVCERGHDRFGVALVTRTLGELHLARNDLPAAREHLTAALALWTELGLDVWRARTLRDLAAADPSRQDEHWTAALDLLHGTGAREERELAATTPRQWRDTVRRQAT
ncbi:AfsR/SARP family transcriptional regulator [Umezawaea tangerina]|uniref:DNA-binding SARP family transcriptional activator n=1 Tax=Umezawaea tangerina TaxID=84725 RepID=A0A2T0T739_9PSEU|nr:BTAD domain-containing putative transcriptional regulator [Umezawaea tangerina]PRY41458.1 DNA-binding SARP family transcriptional activator [Umezawaea tangerina]